MSDENKVRLAHELLDEINARQDLTPEQTEVLRSFLPERPKQKTLEDVYREVCNAWYRTDGNVWKAETFGELEAWLYGLHEQLKGLIDSKPASPALPEGMRLADHERYGRVVVSPGVGIDRRHEIFYLDPGMISGTDIREVEPESLAFIDMEPVNPTRPEFLETVEDYENAPQRTIVAIGDAAPWVKLGAAWVSATWSGRSSELMDDAPRRVLRWGNK